MFLFVALLVSGAKAQTYDVVSITGKVLVEANSGQKRGLLLRERLTPQSKLNIPYQGQVELFNEAEGKKYVLKVPGTGLLGSMIKDRQNSVMQLTSQYLSYIKERLRSTGEVTSRHYSDPATVTRSVSIKKESADDDDPFAAFQQQAMKEFNDFTDKAMSEYEAFRQKSIREYAAFMREAWKSFGASAPIERPKVKEIPPVKTDSTLRRKTESIPVKTAAVCVMPMPEPEPDPDPKGDKKAKGLVPEQTEENGEYVDFKFFGTPLRVRFTHKEDFKLASVSSNDVADAYERFASADYNNTLVDVLALRDNLQLGDWAYIQMLDSLSAACFPTRNEAVLLMGYLYQQSGYKMRFGVNENELHILFASDHVIYGRGYFPNLDDSNYKFYTYGEDADPLNICQAQFPKEQPLSLIIPKTMQLAETNAGGRLIASTDWRYPEMSFVINVNKNMLDFYNTYPTSCLNNDIMTRWAMYANTPFHNQLEDSLRVKLGEFSELEAAERILNWIQTGMEYEYDENVWGHDRPFFPEETLFYPYCDCEDRAILFTRLMRDLYGVKAMLVYYNHPELGGHLASAIHFKNDEEITGDYIEYEGAKYFICDPTIMGAGAPVGETMEEMDNGSASVVVLR